MDGGNDDCACCWCVAAADYAWYKLVMFKIVVLFSLSSAGNCGVNTDSFYNVFFIVIAFCVKSS